MAHHLFISYNRRDGPWVNALVEALRDVPREIWIDRQELQVSVDWADEVRDAIVESVLLVVCDSPGWRGSLNCQTESAVATQYARPRVVVTVGDHVRQAVATVRAAVSGLDPRQDARVDLAVQARDWDRAGRRPARFVSAAARRRLEAGITRAQPADEVERAFLRGSRRRVRRRLAVPGAVVVVAGGGALLAEGLSTLHQRVANQNARQATDYLYGSAAIAFAGRDPYLGLAYGEGVRHGDEDEAAAVVAASLLEPTPDDAFTVPAAATAFAETTVGSEVVITDGRGHGWGRAAAAGTVRSGGPVTAPPGGSGAAVGSGAGSGQLTYRRIPGSGEVKVVSAGHLIRTLTFSQPPSALAFSPDGRELAGAVGEDVEIQDITLGLTRMRLSGAAGAIRALAWSSDSMRVWGLTSGRVVGWTLRTGTTLRDQSGTVYEGIQPAADPGDVWVASETGVLQEISTSTGAVRRTIRVGGQATTAAGSPDGSLAVLAGAGHEYVVSLIQGTVRSSTVGNCDAGRPVIPNDTLAILPCIGGDLVELTPSGAVLRRIAVSDQGVSYATTFPGTSTILAGDRNGNLYTVNGAAPELLRATQCGGRVLRIAVSRSGQAIAQSGFGTGTIGCTPIGVRRSGSVTSPTGWAWNEVADSTQRSGIADAVVFNQEGTVLADGFSDGTIVLRPTLHTVPDATISSLVGPIRDMMATAGDRMLVATAAGIVASIPICPGCLTNQGQAAIAAARLRRAVQLGLTSSIPVQRPPAVN
jgi:WD40 repeat protein